MKMPALQVQSTTLGTLAHSRHSQLHLIPFNSSSLQAFEALEFERQVKDENA